MSLILSRKTKLEIIKYCSNNCCFSLSDADHVLRRFETLEQEINCGNTDRESDIDDIDYIEMKECKHNDKEDPMYQNVKDDSLYENIGGDDCNVYENILFDNESETAVYDQVTLLRNCVNEVNIIVNEKKEEVVHNKVNNKIKDINSSAEKRSLSTNANLVNKTSINASNQNCSQQIPVNTLFLDRTNTLEENFGTTPNFANQNMSASTSNNPGLSLCSRTSLLSTSSSVNTSLQPSVTRSGTFYARLVTTQ